jgi:hypothetical protein
MGGVRRVFSVRSWYPFGVVIVLHENQTGEFNLESGVEHGFVGNFGVPNQKTKLAIPAHAGIQGDMEPASKSSTLKVSLPNVRY